MKHMREKDGMNENQIGATVRARRKELALTQADVAALAATDRNTISSLEQGAGTRLSTFLTVADVLGLHVTVAGAD
jgi:HTH-type transcriptional regulator / antitoxin HipB